MKIKITVLAVSAALVAASSLVFAQAQTQANPQLKPQPQQLPSIMPSAGVQPGVSGAPQTSEQWVNRMMDFRQNASAFKDPATFAAWTHAMTDPSMVATMGTQMMEPGNMLRSMTTMMQPATTGNYMQFMDPNMYMRWGGAMMNPAWYAQMAASMSDPSKMMRWMMLPMDPKIMGMGMQMMDPNWYVKWMMTPTDPRAMALMFAPMNPQLYGSMMGGAVDTKSMGYPWGTFMNPSQPVISVQSAAPVANPINVFDPTTWVNMMNMFGGMPALPAVSFPFGSGTPNAYLQPGGAPAAGPAAPPAVQPAKQAAAMRLSLGGDALFKSGKTSIRDLTTEGRKELDALVEKIKAAGAIETVTVTGHADKMGKPAVNKRLSLARAKAVESYLKSKGVKAKRFTTVGMGDTQPVVECDMAQAKAALTACLAPNRRVEIEVAGVKP